MQKKNAELETLMKSWAQPRFDPGRSFSVAMSAHLGLPGLRGFWPGSGILSSGNLVDASGQGRTLTYNGNPTIGLDNIMPYLDLDGTGDFWSRADEADLDIVGTEAYIASALRGLTIGAWVNFDNTAAAVEVIAGKDDNSAGVSYSIQRDAAGNAIFRVSNTGSSGAIKSVSSAGTLSASKWYHVVGRFVPSESVDVFVDGVLATNTASVYASLFNSASAFVIGAYSGGTQLMAGKVCLSFLCAAALPDRFIKWVNLETRAMFNRRT